METLGIRHGLTAVEASYLLDVKPTRLVTEILYSLLKKRAVWVESTKEVPSKKNCVDIADATQLITTEKLWRRLGNKWNRQAHQS